MKDPKKFVAEVAEVDPAALSNIITLLEGLLTTSQDTEADLINKVNDETQKSLQTAEHVMDAERALEDAEALQTTAEQNLENAKAVVQTKQQQLAQRKQDHDDQKARQDLAQKEHDDVIDSLNNEQQVLIDVIRMLKELHESQNAEESGFTVTLLMCNGNCNKAQARTLCESSGLALAAPNTRDEWTALLAAIPNKNAGYWIAGHDGKAQGSEHVGASGSDSYSEGKFYPPHGQSELYIGCNAGEDGLVAAKYSGSGATFDGCMGAGGSGNNELILMDEHSSYSHSSIIGALCS